MPETVGWLRWRARARDADRRTLEAGGFPQRGDLGRRQAVVLPQVLGMEIDGPDDAPNGRDDLVFEIERSRQPTLHATDGRLLPDGGQFGNSARRERGRSE